MLLNHFTIIIISLSIFGFLVTECLGLNILAITPHIGKSHQLVFEPLFKKLVSNGHRLTLITRYPIVVDSPHWRIINISPDQNNNTELFSFNLLTGTRLDRYKCPVILALAADIACSEGLSHPNLQNFVEEKNKFDVVLVEMFNTNCFMGVAKKYDAPIIGLHSSCWMPWMYQWFGIPYNPATLTNHFLGNNYPMDFLERLESTVMHIFTNILYTVRMGWTGDSMSRKYLGIDLYRNGDIMKQISLLLINTHFTLNLPTPLAPNTVEIGGVHVDSQPLQKLPQEMEKFVNESKHGVIYMSMGSTIRGDTFPEEKKWAFLKAFSKLPQRVIWKWEGEMKNKPDNVFITRWAPQRDLLCHPNVRVFISHSGLLGTVESVDCGKPMLLLPQFGDQFTNAVSVQTVGGGLAFTLKNVDENVLLDALKKLLSPQFARSAQSLSKRFKDRPLSPMDTAIYWINYVVKHNGAHFMKTATVDMPIYQYLLLDVTAVLILFSCLGVYLFYLFLSKGIKLFRKKNNKIKTS